MTALADCKILTFDCYGTLIDWETGVWDALQPLLMANGTDRVTRRDGLALFAEVESAQQAAAPDMLYGPLLAEVHRQIAARIGLESSAELDTAFGEARLHWPAFADSADALRRLKRHVKLAVLTNTDREGFAASNRKLGVEFDAIYTAQDAGSYKPDPRNFDYMLARLKADFGLSPADLLHTAQSLFHDHTPAKDFGLANCWIDRQRLSEGGDWGATRVVERRPETDHRFYSMMEFAEALEAARA